MNTPEEQLWNRVADASRPNAAEMAAAEAELRALDGAEPLPGNLLDSVLERATAPEPVTTLRLVEPTRRGWKKVMLLAALLLVSVSGIAWVVLKQTWTEKSTTHVTLDYAEAILVATEPGYEEHHRFKAISWIEDHCIEAARVLRTLSALSDARLAAPAARIQSNLSRLLSSGPTSRPGKVDAAFLDLINAALNERLPVEERLSSLQSVEHQVAAGLTAIMLARPFFAGEARAKHDVVLARLARVYGE